MIVKCDKCQTRFKIPDEKVTDKGVKVRCTRCQNAFRVSKTSEAPPTDPFDQFAMPRVEPRAPVPPPMPGPPPPPMSFDGWNGAASHAVSSDNGFDQADSPGGLLGDVPAFGELMGHSSSVPSHLHTGAEVLPPAEADRVLFDMVPPPSAPGTSWPAEEKPIELPPVTRTAEATAVTPVKEERADLSAGPSVVRGALGVLANVLVASGLLVVLLSVGSIYLNEGRFDLSAVSLDAVKAIFARPAGLLAVDVSNGLYETRGSRDVFYVRGEVENRGTSMQRAQVTVEILDGSLALTRADVLAGASPTPEELYEVSSPRDLDALNARLAKAATEVKPGARVPFLVAFQEYPPELSQYRLRVTVRDASEAAH